MRSLLIAIALIACGTGDQPTTNARRSADIGVGPFVPGGGPSSGGGGGTITAVVAGTGMTGGGSSGSVTLNASNALTNTALASNTIVKGTGANALATATPTDDGTTFTVPEAFTTSGTTTLGDSSHATTVGQNLTSIAGITAVGQLTGVIISPTAITGTVNDWAPTGLATALYVNVSLSGTTTLNGLTGGTAGRTICLLNSSASNLTIAHAAGASAAANRFSMVGATSLVVGTGLNEWICFVYDGTASLWRHVGTTHFGSINVSGGTIISTLSAGATTVTGKIAMGGGASHFSTTGTAPSLSSCGTSPAITGTDVAGFFTVGSAITTCTVTFAGTFTNEPSCIIHTSGSATEPTCTVTATAITCSVVVASTKYYYHCTGLI